MSTTIQADRHATQVEPPRIERAVLAVPDHVPPEVAAEHPDAAAVVSSQSARPAPDGGVHLVRRSEEQPAWALRILGLIACAVFAAVPSSSDSPAAAASPAVGDAAVTTTTPPAVSTPEAPQPPQGCAPAAPVAVRCESSCGTPTLLEFPWQSCSSTRTTVGR